MGAKREPKGSQKGAKGEPKGSQKGAKRVPKGSQKGAKSNILTCSTPSAMCIFIEKTVIGTSFIKSKSSEEFIFTYLIPFDTGPCTSSLKRKKIKFSSVVLRKSLEKRVKAYLKSVSKGL